MAFWRGFCFSTDLRVKVRRYLSSGIWEFLFCFGIFSIDFCLTFLSFFWITNSDLFLFLIFPTKLFWFNDSFDPCWFLLSLLTNSSKCSFCWSIAFFRSPDLNLFLDYEFSLEHDLDFLLVSLYNLANWLKSVGFDTPCSVVEKKFLLGWFLVVDGTTAYSVCSLLFAFIDWLVLYLAILLLNYRAYFAADSSQVRCLAAPFSSW